MIVWNIQVHSLTFAMQFNLLHGVPNIQAEIIPAEPRTDNAV
jgi:hypothetical protein